MSLPRNRSRSGGIPSFLFVSILLVAPTLGHAAQESQSATGASITDADRAYRVRAMATDSPPVIDGVLDDAVWQRAEPLTEFVQSQPSEGADASERTEVRVLYDADNIYISAMMWDSDPDGVVASVLRRDEDHGDNDAFAVTFDTYHDHRNGFYFETNALGARYDAQIIGEGGTQGPGGGQSFNDDWDAVWYAAGQRTDEGWSVEISIPFWALRFDRDSVDGWGINFRRTIRRKSEHDYWAPVPRQFGATRLSQSGMLVGMQGLGSPKTVQVKPYVRGDLGQFPSGPDGDPFASHSTDANGDLGGDIKWSVTPNLTLDGTVNTDFAQVEADDVQINLTRFPLFFPEKREFFLENAGLFSFGTNAFGGDRALGFHSRRIGISEGREVPLLGGARLSGKAGAWDVGLLSMQTGSVDEIGLGSQNSSVVRVRRDLGDRSNVGVMVTNRQAGGDDYNRAIGFDGRWSLSSQARVDAWWMQTQGPDELGESEWAGAARFDYATPEVSINAAVMQVGDGFNPELGFVSRHDIRAYDSTVMWTPFPEADWVRNLSPHISWRYVTDREGRLLSRHYHFDWDLFLRRGDKLSVAHNRSFEQLDAPFQIVPGVFIQPGAYHFDELNLEFQSDQSRPVWTSFNYTWGDFWDGTRKQLRLSAGARVGARFSGSVSLNRNDVDLSDGSFITDLWQGRVAYDFNTRLFISGLFQYDSLSNQLFSNVRLNFIHTPGADLFLVYNERRLTEDPTLIDRAIIVKLTQLLRL